jgi:hypothetical protein
MFLYPYRVVSAASKKPMMRISREKCASFVFSKAKGEALRF